MKPLFPKIADRPKLSQVIENKITELIRTKKLVAGQKLPTEKELCEMFGVSRTSLREALHMLSAKGLITVRKGSGIFVNDYSSDTAQDFMSFYLELSFDKDTIIHVVKVRQILEPDIAKLAAMNRTETDLKNIENIINEFKICDKCDAKRLGELDREYHLALANATGNPLIPVIIDPVFRLMPKIRTMVYSKIDQAESSAEDYHSQIFQCLLAQDTEGAQRRMEEHLKIAEKHSIEVVESI